MKKRIVALTVAASMGLLTACGSSSSSSELGELRQEIKELEEENDELKESLAKYTSGDTTANDATASDTSASSTSVIDAITDATASNDTTTSTTNVSSENSELVSLASQINVDNCDDWGMCGDNLYWYYKNNILVIRGTGAITDNQFNWVVNKGNMGFWDDALGDISDTGRNGIVSVVIEDGCTRIGNCAFYDCASLSNVVIPSTVTEIGDEAFQYCDSLASVVIPASVTEVGSDAFYSCDNLASVVLSEGIEDITGWNISCGTLTLPNSLKYISYYEETDELGNTYYYIRNYAYLDVGALIWNGTTYYDDYVVFCDGTFYSSSDDFLSAYGVKDWMNLLNAYTGIVYDRFEIMIDADGNQFVEAFNSAHPENVRNTGTSTDSTSATSSASN